MDQPTIFISYSHKDEEWKDDLLVQLKSLADEPLCEIWHDRQIDPGGKWYTDIRSAIDRSAIAICLISSEFLASQFCTREEVPHLLQRSEEQGLLIIPILVRPCPWQREPWLKNRQMLPRDGKSVVSLGMRDAVFEEVAGFVEKKLRDPHYKPPTIREPGWDPPAKIDLSRLPMTGAELFGRAKEKQQLDSAWEGYGTNVVSLVGQGGVGKSTLVNHWLRAMAGENYQGAQMVFGWSFHSQGTRETATSADPFIAKALGWFGDPDPTAGYASEKGERLAALVRERRTLLVLDGMEPLQSDFEDERGKIKDLALAILVEELARDNQGLCVITSRVRVAELSESPDTTYQQDLSHISAESGRALLRVAGVRGDEDDLLRASCAFGNHALAVNLLGRYLYECPEHHVSHVREIRDGDIPDTEDKHPRRVMAAFEARFGEGPEVELLRLLGLFDRPADGMSVRAVLFGSPITQRKRWLRRLLGQRKTRLMPGLTEHLARISETEWLRLVKRLRDTGLVAPESSHSRDSLDAHPLVREHFKTALRHRFPAAWREAHDRLFEHCRKGAETRPETLESMMPLYYAVAHGCQAGRHRDALWKVYWDRIYRNDSYFSSRKLGAFGANLAALSGFFTKRWNRPVKGLDSSAQAFLLDEAGTALQALGQLFEAKQPMEEALKRDIARGEGMSEASDVDNARGAWASAANDARNLSLLFLVRGDLSSALEVAQQSAELADRSGDLFQRMASRTNLASALHMSGRLTEAESLFHEAEAVQRKFQPPYPQLYGLQGFAYCDLLLEQGRCSEAKERAEICFEWRRPEDPILDIALDHLSLGRALLIEAQETGAKDFTLAADHLNEALNGLRQSRQIDELPRGLLVRAALHRLTGDFARARRDVGATLNLAHRTGMRLHEADAQLEYTWLYLAMGHVSQARESLNNAKAIIIETGYHRRDRDVEALEQKFR